MIDSDIEPIFYNLVKSDKDILGILTYVHYKRHKIAYLEGIKAKRGSISKADLNQFRQSINENTISHFSSSAEKSLASLAEGLVNEHRDQITAAILKKSEEVIARQKSETEEFIAQQKVILMNFEKSVEAKLSGKSRGDEIFTIKNFVWSLITALFFSLIWGLLSITFWYNNTEDPQKSDLKRQAQKAFVGKGFNEKSDIDSSANNTLDSLSKNGSKSD